MEVKNSDERTELMNASKSKNKKIDNKLKGQSEKDNFKTDIINLDKPMNSNSSNNLNIKNEIFVGDNKNKNMLNNNENLLGDNKVTEPNYKLNGNDGSKNNIKGKQEDISIFDITKGGRIITDLEVKNAPILILEVIFIL